MKSEQYPFANLINEETFFEKLRWQLRRVRPFTWWSIAVMLAALIAALLD